MRTRQVIVAPSLSLSLSLSLLSLEFTLENRGSRLEKLFADQRGSYCEGCTTRDAFSARIRPVRRKQQIEKETVLNLRDLGRILDLNGVPGGTPSSIFDPFGRSRQKKFMLY
jgi:hypothetical protein